MKEKIWDNEVKVMQNNAFPLPCWERCRGMPNCCLVVM